MKNYERDCYEEARGATLSNTGFAKRKARKRKEPF